MKKLLSVVLTIAFLLTLASCGGNSSSSVDGNANNNSADASEINTTKPDIDPAEKTIEKGKKKSVEEDDDLGLMNVKIQDAEGLSEIEKLMVEYFDTDYFDCPVYSNLQRYPKIYKGSQLMFQGVIVKTIESTDDNYVFVMEYEATKEDVGQGYHAGNYVVLKGKQGDERLIEGDQIFLRGKYSGVETYTVDGESITVPTIFVNRYAHAEYFISDPFYTMKDIRSIAQYIFGDDINIKETDYTDFDNPDDAPEEAMPGTFYTVELENQSNANFTKYMFWAGKWGRIFDLKSSSIEERNIIFAADFEHFYVEIFNHQLKTFSIACYDLELNKIWKREFDDTTSAVIDYTASHMYLVANGYMYILDTDTGEDAVDKKYVGQKIGIRKLSDGILLVQEGPSDAFMKTDLSGNVLWTVNTKYTMFFSEYVIVQIVDGNYVAIYSPKNNEVSGDVSIVISPEGTVIYEGETK